MRDGFATSKPKPDREPVEYHVLHDGRRWEVHRDHAFTGAFAHDANDAVMLAIRSAESDRARGIDASVCIEQKDGCRHAWP